MNVRDSPPRAYRLVVFDFDGTLADSFPWFMKNINAVADRFRFRRIAPHALDHLRGCGTRELLAHLELPAWKVPRVAAEMRRLMAHGAADVRLFDGVDRMLARLAQCGIATAVLSSNSHENVRRILGARNLAYVRHVECGASLFGKRARLVRLLRRTRYPPQHVLCIGDEIRDAQAAAAAGLDFAGVSWGYARAEALAAHSPRMLFENVEQIADTLCR